MTAFWCVVIAALFSSAAASSEALVCLACRTALQNVQDAFTGGNVHINALGQLEKVCDSVTPERQDVCRAVLDGLTQDVLRQLLADMEPDQLCVAMSACPSDTEGRNKVDTKASPSLGVSNETCVLCEFVVRLVDTLLQNHTSPSAANATVIKICDLFSEPTRDVCVTFAPLIVDAILKGVDPYGACTNIGLCLTGVPIPIGLKNSVEKVEAGPECAICELLVQTIDAYLQDNRTVAAINSTVFKVCDSLTGTIKSACLLLAPQLVSVLAQGFDPQKACTTIKLCASGEDKASVIFTRELEAGPACELCELLIQTIDSYLKDNKTEAAINATVYKVCNSLPDSIKSTCLGFASQLVAVLSQGVDPQQACTYLKLCSSVSLTENGFSFRTIRSVQVTPECELCELLVQIIDIYLKQNESEAAINATVYKVCNSLSGTYKILCFGLAPQLVAVLAQGLNPQQACAYVKLCTSDSSLEEQLPLRQEQAGPVCELCELLIQTIDSYLKDNKTEAAINATVYKVCSSLPDPIKSTCLAIAPDLVTVLSLGVNPHEACAFIKLCTSAQELLLKSPFSPTSVSDLQDEMCEVCKTFFEFVDNDLYQDEGQVQSLLEEICHRLPPPTDQACLNAVIQDFPNIWETVLSKAASPESICKLLTLCSA